MSDTGKTIFVGIDTDFAQHIHNVWPTKPDFLSLDEAKDVLSDKFGKSRILYWIDRAPDRLTLSGKAFSEKFDYVVIFDNAAIAEEFFMRNKDAIQASGSPILIDPTCQERDEENLDLYDHSSNNLKTLPGFTSLIKIRQNFNNPIFVLSGNIGFLATKFFVENGVPRERIYTKPLNYRLPGFVDAIFAAGSASDVSAQDPTNTWVVNTTTPRSANGGARGA